MAFAQELRKIVNKHDRLQSGAAANFHGNDGIGRGLDMIAQVEREIGYGNAADDVGANHSCTSSGFAFGSRMLMAGNSGTRIQNNGKMERLS